jgi:hypothetical protein
VLEQGRCELKGEGMDSFGGKSKVNRSKDPVDVILEAVAFF